MQDIALCEARYSMAICRPIALQFTGENSVALLELAVREENEILKLNVVDEKHYELSARTAISENELRMLKESEL
jgi:hypothetical protein